MKNLLILIVLVISATALMAAVYMFSDPRVKQQILHKQERLAQQMLGDEKFTRIQYFELLAPRYLHMGDAQVAQRVFDGEKATTVILTSLSDQAYAGRIALLVGITNDCSIASVDVLQSQETPGLGDQYKKNKGAWLKNFKDKNLSNANWKLKKQGGDFDAWTGATVTPRAIVETLNRTLALCEAHQSALFSNREIVYLEQ